MGKKKKKGNNNKGNNNVPASAAAGAKGTADVLLNANRALPQNTDKTARPGKYKVADKPKDDNKDNNKVVQYTPDKVTYTPATYTPIAGASNVTYTPLAYGGDVTYNPVEWNPSTIEQVNEAGIREAYQKTADEANAAYRTAYETKVKGLQEAANANRETANNRYDTGARNAYGNYLEAQKNARETAANTGMTGGAVEKMAVNSANNYQKSYSANEAGRQKALADIQADYNEKQSSAQVDYQNTVAANNLAAQTQAQQSIDTANNEYQNRLLQQEQMKQDVDIANAQGQQTVDLANAQMRQNVDLQNAQGQQNTDIANAQMQQNVNIANAQGQQAVDIANAQGQQAVDVANANMQQDAYLDYLNRQQSADQNKANLDVENRKIDVDEKQYQQNQDFQKEQDSWNRFVQTYGQVTSPKVLKKEINRYDDLIKQEEAKDKPDKKKIKEYKQRRAYLKSVKGNLKLNK